MYTLFGIKNCGTCKKARNWLDEHNCNYKYHDFRENGLNMSLLEELERKIKWENLLNRRSTTWKGLSKNEQDNLDRQKALELMLQYPTLIKRPILSDGEHLILGFSPENYAQK